MSQIPDPQTALDELQVVGQLINQGEYEPALDKVNEWLESHPDDRRANLLKIGLCLKAKSEPAFIAATLDTLAADKSEQDRVAALRNQVVALAEQKLAEAKGHLKDRRPNLAEALNCLDFALALVPKDASIPMAAAVLLSSEDADLALEETSILNRLFDKTPLPSGQASFDFELPDWFNNLELDTPKRRLSEAPRRKAIERYLELALERGKHSANVYQAAMRQLMIYHLAQVQVEKVLDLLNTLPSGEDLDALRKEATHQITVITLRLAVNLLCARQNSKVAGILAACAAAWPALPAIPALQAEIDLQEGHPEAAVVNYQKSIHYHPVERDCFSFDDACIAWNLAHQAQIVCPACGADISLPADQCRLCATSLRQWQPIAERFREDKFSDPVLARIGLAIALAACERIPEAIDLIDEMLRGLSRKDKAYPMLVKQRGEWYARIQSQAAPKPANLASEGLSAVSREGLTARTLIIINAASENAPEDWIAIALAERLKLARSLVRGEHLVSAQLIMKQAFKDVPGDTRVRRLAREQARMVQKRLNRLMEKAQLALSADHPDLSMTTLEDVFDLQADYHPAYLLRGKIRLKEENLLPALEDFRQVLAVSGNQELVIQAYLGAATALEQYLDFEGALTMLNAVPPDRSEALRARIGRKQRGEPAVLVERTQQIVMHDTLQAIPETGHYIGVFAIAIRAIGQPQSHPQENWQQRMHAAAFEFIQVLGDLRNVEGDPIFSLRLVSHPHASIPERGRLTIALLARVSAQGAPECTRLALDLWRMVADVLPSVQEYIYVYEPITDSDELKSLLQPFEVETIAEIARRHEFSRRGDECYAVYPFTPGSADLHNLCWFLLRQKAPAALSITLLPTEAMEWERTALNSSAASVEKSVTGEAGEAPIATAVNDPIAFWSHEAVRWGQAQANRHTLNAFHGHTYLVRVSLALAAGVNPLLPESVAAAMLGPVHPVGETLYGGYEVVHTTNGEEFEIARRNFEQLDVQSWGFSLAPESTRRLRYLFGEHEAAILFRLPMPGREGVPGVPGIDARPIPPPVGMPARGTVLGESVTRLNGVPLRITQSTADRRRHTYIVGKTGVGKTTLIQRMALQDIEAGHGVCLVDPHGDLVNDVLDRIPPQRMHDVVLFDPSDEERPVGLNLLEARTDAEKHRIVSEFIGLLFRMYDPHQMGIVGPRFEHNVRNAMLTVMSVEGNTLIEVVRALTDQKYVQSLLPHVTDPLVRNYWERQIANTSDFHKSEILDYIVSKFSRFVGNRLVRNIIGQRSTTLNFREIMDKRKILLVNLSKGKIGAESAQFLGLLLMQRLLISALSRANVSADRRPDFFLYVDEFQNFATELFGTILSEGRKYGVAAVVANQYLTQLDKDIHDAIFGNVGTIISFRVGTQDAAALVPELYPVFGVDDLVNLPRYTTCVKLLVDGISARPFTMRTVPDTRPADRERGESIRKGSRQTYGRDVGTITQEVEARLADFTN